MSAEVCIQFEITPEYYSEHFAASGKTGSRPGSAVLAYAAIAFVCSLPFALWCVWHSDGLDMKWLVIATLVSPLAIGFLAIRLFSVKRVLGESLETLSVIDRQVSITANSDGWLIETAFSRTEQQWPVLRKVTRVNEGIMTTESMGGNRWLPRTGFESEAAIKSFVRLVQGASIEYEDRRTE